MATNGENRVALRARRGGLSRASRMAACAGAVALLHGGMALAAGCRMMNYATLPVEMIDGRATTQVKLNGHDTRLTLDSGAFFNFMSQAKARELGLKLLAPPEELVSDHLGWRLGGKATIRGVGGEADIQSAIVYHPNGGQTSTFVNLNGTYNLGGFFNYGIVLKKPKSNLNFITNVNYAQSQTLVYDSVAADYSHVYSKNTGLGETVSFTTNIKKNFDMNFSYGATYNIGRNTLNSRENLDYLTQKFSAEITAYTNSGWLIATTFDYTNTNNHTAGYNASVPLLSPSIAKSLFKKKNGEIRLTAFDLLNSNTYVNKVISQTGYSVSRTNTLSRYLMLTFTWNLNNFAGSQQNKMPGMFNNFRRGGGGGSGQGGGGGNPFGKP